MIRNKIYRFRRLLKHIVYLRKNFSNWDSIIKRAINGKTTRILNLRSGISFHNSDNNTLSIFREIFIKEVYTKNLVAIDENDIVFDIGANVGVFSLYASRVKGVKVYGFEPHPKNFEKFTNNVKVNNIDNIDCFNNALGLENEDRVMIEGNIPGGHKVSKRDSKEEFSKEMLTVQSITLDSFLKKMNISQIDFLKLDCEGAEGEIITSLGVEGLKKIKKVAIEFHDNHSILNHEEIINYLKKAGFETNLSWDGSSNFGYVYGKL